MVGAVISGSDLSSSLRSVHVEGWGCQKHFVAVVYTHLIVSVEVDHRSKMKSCDISEPFLSDYEFSMKLRLHILTLLPITLPSEHPMICSFQETKPYAVLRK